MPFLSRLKTFAFHFAKYSNYKRFYVTAVPDEKKIMLPVPLKKLR